MSKSAQFCGDSISRFDIKDLLLMATARFLAVVCGKSVNTLGSGARPRYSLSPPVLHSSADSQNAKRRGNNRGARGYIASLGKQRAQVRDGEKNARAPRIECQRARSGSR